MQPEHDSSRQKPVNVYLHMRDTSVITNGVYLYDQMRSIYRREHLHLFLLRKPGFLVRSEVRR